MAISPFYSVILGFRDTTDSPPLLSWIPKPTLCQPVWWLVISLFLIVFFFWCCFPKSFLLTFHSGVSLESWPRISLPSRLLNLTFSDSVFWLSFFLSFFPSEPNLFLPGWRLCGCFFLSTQAQVETRILGTLTWILGPLLVVLVDWVWFTAVK